MAVFTEYFSRAFTGLPRESFLAAGPERLLAIPAAAPLVAEISIAARLLRS
jgi:hypothetical protein